MPVKEPLPLNLWVGPVDPRLPWNASVLSANNGRWAAFTVDRPVTVSQVRFSIATQSGNIDFGLYDDPGTGILTLLASTGSFACPAAGVRTQALSGPVTLVPGRRYFAAYAVDNTTTSIHMLVVTSSTLVVTPGLAFFRSGSFPLPASAAIPAVAATTVGSIVMTFS